MRYASDATDIEASRETTQAAEAFKIWDLLDLARRRRILILGCTAGMTALAFMYVLAQTPVYRATSELLIDPTALQVVGRDIVRADTAASIDLANVDSQALVIVSTPVLRQVAEDLHLENDPAFSVKPGFFARATGAHPTLDQQLNEVVEDLKRTVVVHRVDNTFVFQIVVSHPNSEQAARIANEVATVYLQRGNDVRSNSVSRANASLISQIAGLRAQLSEAENAVELFRSQNGLISTGSSGLVVTQQLKDLYTQIGLANAELSRQAARKDEAAKYGLDSALNDTLPEALTSPVVLALRTQYAQTAQTAASLEQTLMPQHPRLMEIKAELKETQKLLSTEINRIRASTKKSYDQAAANLANLQARANELTKTQVTSSSAEIRLRQLESEAEAISSVYNASLARAKELEQQQKIETSNSRLLSEAAPPLKPTKPPAAIVLAAAAMFGAIAGLALAYLLELLPRLRRPSPVPPPDSVDSPGTETVIRVPRASPSWRRRVTGGTTASNEAAVRFAAIAEDLQTRFGHRLPAVVGFADPMGGKPMPDAMQGLADALATRGEAVLICDGTPDQPDLKVRRVAPSPVARKRPMPSADRAARWQAASFKRARVMEPDAEPAQDAAPATGPEFLLVPLAKDASTPNLGQVADAIIVTVDRAKISEAALRDFIRSIDPEGDRVIAIAEREKDLRLQTSLQSFAANLRQKAVA